MDKNKSPSVEEVRQRRLAYFQNTSQESDPAAGQHSDKQQKHGPSGKNHSKNGSEHFSNLGQHNDLAKQAAMPNTRSTKGARTLRTGQEASNVLGQRDTHTEQAAVPSTRSAKGVKTSARKAGGNEQTGRKFSGTRAAQVASAALEDDLLSKDWNSHVEQLFRKGHQKSQETKILSRGDSQELLRESQDLDAVSMFRSEVDCQDLGLSTHRPDSDRNQNNNADLMESSLSQEMKNLLGASKYQEFVEKSVKDINELYQNKTTETSPHLIKSLIEQRDVEQERGDSGHGRTETEGHMNNQVQSRSPRHRLNRPRKEPVHIQNLVAKTKQDLELEGSESLPASVKNYEQITVAPKVTFSADEIYRQAYGPSGTQLQRGVPVQAMSYNQAMPFHPAMMMNMPSGSFQAPSVGFQSPQGPFQPPSSNFQPPHGHFPPDFTQPPPGMHAQSNPGMHAQPTPGIHAQPTPGMHAQPTPGMHAQPTAGMHAQPIPGMHAQPTPGMHGHPPGPYTYGGQPDMFTPRSPPTPTSPHPIFYQPYVADPGFHGYQGYSNIYQQQAFSPPAYNTQYTNYAPAVHLPHPPPQPPAGTTQQPPGVYYPLQVAPTVPHQPHPPMSPPTEVQVQNQKILTQTPNTVKDKSSKNIERAKARDKDKVQRKKGEDEREEGAPAPDRHIEAIRIHHEQRRQMQEDKMNEVFHMEKQKKFAQASLDRYFSSLENIYRGPNSPQGSFPQTEEEAEETPEDEPEDGEAADEAGEEDAVDEDAFTSVTATSVKAGGITDRLERLGIDVGQIKSKNAAKEGDEDDKQKKRKKVKVCPGCASWNKEYMSWCADCGEILIGVESIVARRKEKRKENADRKENVEVKPESSAEQSGPAVSTRKSISISPEILSYRHDSDMKVSVTKPSQMDSHMKQLERAKQDLAKPNTGSSAPGNYIRSPQEINDLCEVINDPVIRGFIKNYFSRKAKADDVVEAETDEKEQEADEVTPKADVDNDLSDGEVILNLQSSENFESPPANHQKGGGKKFPSHGDIDVEIFGIEDSRESRTSSRNAPVVPSLDLHDSSDDEEVVKARRLAMKTQPVSFSIDTDDWSSVNESQQLNPAEESPDLPQEVPPEEDDFETPRADNSDEGNPSQDPSFLAHILAMRSNSSRPERQRPRSADLLERKRMSRSIVRESIEAEPYQRHWEKSSIAWSSFHPRELSTRSSVKNFMVQDPRVKFSIKKENMVTADAQRPEGRGVMQAHKKSRPASADLYRRKVQSSVRPTSAQVRGNHQPRVRDTDPPNLSPSQTSVIAHRLPQEDPQPPMARTLQGPSAAITAYHMYMEMTPRIEEGEFSKWQCLPDEIWLYIFSFLPHSDLARVALACKQFCRISVDDSLWRHITVKKNHAICDQWLAQIAKRHPVSLALIQCHGDSVTAKGLRELFRECIDDLKELNFSRCSRGGLTGDSILLHASARCRNLTHVDASWCHVTDNGLTALSESAHRLESLCLNGCQMLSDEGVETVIKKHGSSLRVLELFGCFNLTPRCIRCIATHCTNLLTINLGQCFRLTDSSITHLSASLGRVENLDLRGCKQIRDNCIRKIVRNCPRLKTIIIANCPHVSDAALIEIATYSMDVRSLDICGCRNVTDQSIRTLANNCQRLTTLDISSSGCTHRSVTLLASYCNRNLETLKLNFLADITEACLQKLVKNCKKLKTLHLYGCTSVRSVDKLMQLCPFLHVEM